MLKLYKKTSIQHLYWETWDNEDGTHTVHWGILGSEGQSKRVKKKLLKTPEQIIQKEVYEKVKDGFREAERQFILLIEYEIEGMGSEADLEKRHRLEDRMNETLGWTGLGNCDGGSSGSGTMEVCNFVVDYEVAKQVIEADLKDTEFETYSRIYCEGELED